MDEEKYDRVQIEEDAPGNPRYQAKVKQRKLLAMLLADAELTAKQFAEKAGISDRTFAEYVNARILLTDAKAMTVYQMAKTFGCPIEVLLGLQDVYAYLNEKNNGKAHNASKNKR